MTERSARDLPYVKGCIEAWARWCHGGGVVGISTTGKLMRGVRPKLCRQWVQDYARGRRHDPHCLVCKGRGVITYAEAERAHPRVCPVCEGRRQNPTDRWTTFSGRECFRCRGIGWVVVEKRLVNPMAIPSTRHVGDRPPDTVCTLIDDQVTQWREADETIWLARAVSAEFFWNYSQDDKARELRVSVSFFKKRLREAYYRVEVMLEEKMP